MGAVAPPLAHSWGRSTRCGVRAGRDERAPFVDKQQSDPAVEAFAGDIPTPLKKRIACETDVYKRVCDGLDVAIAQALGLQLPEEGSADWKVIKAADGQAFKIEAARLVPNAVEAQSSNAVPDLEEPWSPMEAEKAFLAAHRAASKLVGNGQPR